MGNPERSANDNSTDCTRPLEEKQWARRVREEGDRDAFEKIFRMYYKRLLGFAYSFVKRSDVAEDIVQSLFLKIWEQRENWDPPGTIKNYLFIAIRNEALNVLRHEKIVDNAETEISRQHREVENIRFLDENPEIEDLRKAIQDGIDLLPPQCCKIFMLSRQSGLTYAEIAEVLDISINTVGTQMGRALSYLRKHLSDYLSLVTIAEVSSNVFKAVFLLLFFLLMI